MKTHEELVQTARVLHKALKVDLTIYGGDRDCIVKFTKTHIPRNCVEHFGIIRRKCGNILGKRRKIVFLISISRISSRLYESEGHRGG